VNQRSLVGVQLSRRETLGLLAAGIASTSGCAALDDAAEAAVEAGETSSPTPEPRGTIPLGGFQTPEPTPTSTPRQDVGDIIDFVENNTAGPAGTPTDSGFDPNELDPIPVYDIDHSTEVEAGSYIYWDLDLPSRLDEGTDSVTLQYEAIVRNGPPVDWYLLEATEFESYSSGENFLYRTRASATDTKFGDVSVTIRDIRLYVFLVDNTNAGDADPAGRPVDVDVELVVE